VLQEAGSPFKWSFAWGWAHRRSHRDIFLLEMLALWVAHVLLTVCGFGLGPKASNRVDFWVDNRGLMGAYRKWHSRQPRGEGILGDCWLRSSKWKSAVAWVATELNEADAPSRLLSPGVRGVPVLVQSLTQEPPSRIS
jgi:hypothetical protein